MRGPKGRPRIILGVFNGNDASVSLLQGGEVRFAAQEERFNRVKLTRGYPERAIEACLAFAGLSRADIDAVACGAWAEPDPSIVEDYLQSTAAVGAQKAAERMSSSLRADAPFHKDFLLRSRELFPNASIHAFDHHASHAHTAFHASPYARAYVLTADARGGLASTVVWRADREHGLRRVRGFCELKSLGALYGQVTGLLGFTPYRHEGKVTGLAAYGSHGELCDRMHDLLRVEGGDFRVGERYRPFARWDYADLRALCEGFADADIAYAVQYVLEQNVLALIGAYVPEGELLCLAGGCFANVKLNQRIREQTHVAGCFVFPEMGDGGNSFGGALCLAAEHGLTGVELPDVYLGPALQLGAPALASCRVEAIADPDALCERVAELLIEGRVVGLVSGRMEYGPRALGARSILVAATDPGINKSVNARLHRTEFMPFAPVTLAREAQRMYRRCDPADRNLRFMTTCYDCSDEMKRLSPAVVHVDGTARPQLVGGGYGNPLYVGILERYFQKTGIPSLVNTSFNNHEEPIVCSAEDAIASLHNGNVDCVVSDGLLLWPG
jgi:carbamoyltransferase